ncbi:MAG: dUTP diphosphatase [Magnetococcales bacterium]|nr:dUTP diphosphatase [Magnetococcales bacterium]
MTTQPDPLIPIHVLPHGAGIPLPRYMTPGSAGMDLMAATTGAVTLAPGGRALLPTGLTLEIPTGWEAQIRPRSGLAFKHGVTVLNAPGTIDSDYRGEVGVLLINLGGEPFTIQRGDRIAQMVVARIGMAAWQPASGLEPSERGTGGFGHTGR